MIPGSACTWFLWGLGLFESRIRVRSEDSFFPDCKLRPSIRSSLIALDLASFNHEVANDREILPAGPVTLGAKVSFPARLFAPRQLLHSTTVAHP